MKRIYLRFWRVGIEASYPRKRLVASRKCRKRVYKRAAKARRDLFSEKETQRSERDGDFYKKRYAAYGDVKGAGSLDAPAKCEHSATKRKNCGARISHTRCVKRGQ